MEELSASDEERMLASIQGARDSAEYEPVNLISTQNGAASSQRKSSWPVPHSDGPLRQIYDDSPTVTSDDDTSLSTWKPPVSTTQSSIEQGILHTIIYYSKTCLKQPLKNRQSKSLKESLMQVKT